MGDGIAAFSSDVFRPIVTLTLPGAMAIWPYLIWLADKHPRIVAFAKQARSESAVVVVAMCVALGFALEDIGAHIENRFDRKRNRHEKTRTHLDDWNRYLRTAFRHDPVGRRYMRTLTLRLKFELGSGLALLIAAIGLGFFGSYASCQFRIGTGLFCIVSAAVMLYEAWSTHGVLGDVRRELLVGVLVAPEEK